MNFALNETQRMLSDSLARYLAREASHASEGFEPAHWERFAEMGLLGLAVPERHGGMGGNAADVAAVMEQFGRAALCSPYVFGVVLAGALLEAGNAAQRDRWLGALASGEERFACALHEIEARHDLLPLATRAEPQGDGSFVLQGAKSNVWYAEYATQVIVAARTTGAPQDADGLSLFVLPVDTAGLDWRHFRTVDGGSAAELRLDGVRAAPAQRLGADAGLAHAAIRLAERRATAALAAESVGLLSVMLDQTVEYTRQRRQFGQPLGAFQALQHRMVDMLIEVEQARSLSGYAAAAFESPSEAEQQRAVSAAKARAGRAGRRITQDAIQLHGGMGMTDELPLSRYVRRQLAVEHSLGDTAFHTDRFSRTEA